MARAAQIAKGKTVAAASPGAPKRHSIGDVFRAMGRPRVALMLAMGFSSGLPFMLTAATLGYWLRDEGTSLKAIGFISWVGLAYSFKFLWSPVVDRTDVPILGKLGRRRGWLLLTQLVLGAGLVAMAAIGPDGGLAALGAAALVVAFASATQDIAVDALRIEAADTDEELGLFTSAFQLGYRIAVLVSDALILFAAQHLGWPASYVMMALFMGVGITATLLIKEPAAAVRAFAEKRSLLSPRGLFDAIVGPFVSFFRTYGLLALVMLLMITLYRLPEFVMGPMATPFYHDLGFQKDFVGGVRLSAGLAGTLAGIAGGGFLAAALGHMRGLIAGAVLQGLAIASFSLLAIFGGKPELFAVVMFFDNFGVGAAGVLLVTYMSSLTSLGYTATQYALLSSTYTWVGKILKGFSGAVVEQLSQGRTLMEGYALFFLGAGAVGIPALLLCVLLLALQRRREAAAPA
ncbi:MAG TPA: MFS transporter [Caulobacteraceae bacterium]|jgi:PAT family beta-lactamase induction signal transducer AmpG